MGITYRFAVQHRADAAPAAPRFWFTVATFTVHKCYEFSLALPLIREEPPEEHSEQYDTSYDFADYRGACSIREALHVLQTLGRAHELIPAVPLLALRAYLAKLTTARTATPDAYRFAVWGS